METQTPSKPMLKSISNGRRARSRRWWIIAIVVILILAIGYKLASKPPPDDTKFTTVTRQDIRQTVSATGAVTLQTAADVKIGAEVSGKVKRLYADVGDRVHAGELVAELENSESDAALRQAKANVDAAAARVRENQASLAMQKPTTSEAIAKAQAGLAAAKAHLQEQLAAANSQPASTAATIAQAEATLAVAQDALVNAKASAGLNVESAQANLDSAEAQAAKAAADARRSSQLLAKGYIAASDADAANTTLLVDNAEVTARKKALNIAIASTKHDVDSAKHGVDQAQAALNSAHAGSSDVTVHNAQVDAARADLNTAYHELASATAGAKQIQINGAQVDEAAASYQQNLADYQRQLGNYAKMKIYAPIDGIVTSVDTKEGETVTAGFQTQTLLTVENLKRIQVDVPVDETDIGKLNVGQKATVTVDAFPNDKLPGRVVKIASGATVDKNVVTYNATVALDSVTLPLKPKMTATVVVDTGLVRNALVLPLDAVKQSKDNDVVFLPPTAPRGKQPSNFPEKTVKTGASDDKVIQVISGVTLGERVILSSSKLEAQRRAMDNS